MELTVFSRKEIERAVPMRDAIESMRDAFRKLSSGEAIAPTRIHMETADHAGTALFMPAYLPDTGCYGMKVVSVNSNNPAKGRPLIHAVIMVMDAESGAPKALMEGSYITALRTGAASGLATDLLANEDAATVVIFGAGVQSRTQLAAICAVRPITKAYVFDPVLDAAERFSTEMKDKLRIDIYPAVSREVIQEADVICTATTSAVPVFRHSELPPGVHINGVGSFKPTMQEIPAETIAAARLVVDRRDSCLSEAGDVLIALEQGQIQEQHILAELGELVADPSLGRTCDADVTVFKSVGNAVQDLAIAAKVMESQESGRTLAL